MESAAEPRHVLGNSLLLFCNFLLVVVFLSGITSNVLVLLVFCRKPGLRTTANRFVINLMIINIVSCISLLPITFADNSSVFPDHYLCFAEQFSSVFCASLAVYSVLLIAIDQYVAVVDPLHYHCIISSWKGCLMIVSTWVVSAVFAFLGSIQPDFEIYHGSGNFRQCGIPPENVSFKEDSKSSSENPLEVQEVEESFPSLYRIIFCIVYASASFVIPFGLICFIYYRICVAASINSRRTRTSLLPTDDSSQVFRDKFSSESNEHEKPTEEKTCCVSEGNSKRQGDERGDLETSDLLRSDSHECSPKPSFVLTRPSPPRPYVAVESKDDFGCECAEKDDCEIKVPKTQEQNSVKAKLETEVPFLKPTLKNNSSFTKLSSLHIQFSTSTEKITNSSERRHSNIPTTAVDLEFENISKSRSPSMQSNFYDIPSRSSSSTRSTTTSIQLQSSRSSSLNSSYVRHPPSRASSIRSTSSYIVHNIRHRISNASLFRYREEARAARISAMVIVMALFCWLPFFTVFSIHSGIFVQRHSFYSHYFDAFSTVFLLSSTVITPFLFAFRNSQIKKEIRKIFQFFPDNFKRSSSKSFYKHNFSLSLKSQTVLLFTELNKNANVKQMNAIGVNVS